MKLIKGKDMENRLPKVNIDTSQTSAMLVKEAEALQGESVKPASSKGCTNCFQNCSTGALLRTLGCYGSFFAIGLLVSLISVSLVELEEATNSTTVQMALLYTWMNIGRLPAVIICGFSFDRYNRELQLGCGLLLLAATGAVVPICTNYYILATAIGLAGAAIGFLGTGCTSMIINLWTNAAFLQGLHLSISIGSVIGPLIVEAFQMTTHVVNSNTTSAIQSNFSAYIERQAPDNINSSSSFQQEIYEDSPIYGQYEAVKFNTTLDQGRIKSSLDMELVGPFIIYTAISLIIVAIFFALWFKSLRKRGSQSASKKAEAEKKNQSGKRSGKLRLVLMGFVFMLLFSLGAFESTYGGLLVQYTYKYLKLSRASSKMVSASFWGGMTSGRVTGLFFSSLGRLEIQIAVYLTVGIVAMALLSSLATAHYAIVWISTIMAGLTISTSVGNSIVVAKKALELNSRGTSLLMFGLYGGMMVGPAVAGQFLSLLGLWTFPYVNLGLAVLMGTSFSVICILKKRLRLQNTEIIEKDKFLNKAQPLLQKGITDDSALNTNV